MGLLEAEAREQGLDVDVRFTDMSDWYSIERVGERHAAAKVLVERGSGRIVGAHLLRPEASELINALGPRHAHEAWRRGSQAAGQRLSDGRLRHRPSPVARAGAAHPVRRMTSAQARNAARLTQIMVAPGQCVTIGEFVPDGV